jgi:hypothetical protein
MLDKQIMKREERPIGHRSFLPQEVVQCEVTKSLEVGKQPKELKQLLCPPWMLLTWEY